MVALTGVELGGRMLRSTRLSAQVNDPRHDPRMRHGLDGIAWDGKK